MTYRLSRHGREHYDQLITTDPPLLAWECSFDGGQTWQAGAALAPAEPGWYRWLVAGDLADPGAAVAILTPGSHQPLARAAGNPEVVVRDLEEIRVK